MVDPTTLSTSSRNIAIGVVLFSALMWAFWWYPVRLIEASGASGSWVGIVMSGAALLVCLPLLIFFPGRMSPRALLGTLLIGCAVTMYTIAVSYTDFVRAVLIFYIAPAWSLMIECFFLGRRWTLRAVASIAGAFIGLILITRGEFSFDGAGAIGDWMALVAGMAWSAGAALVFTARRADFGWSVILTLAGSVLISGLLLVVFGNTFGTPPDARLWHASVLFDCAISGVYLGFILGCTMWGAIRIPPTILSFLLSVEVVAGVAVSAVVLGEQFGGYELFGSFFVIGAILLELTRKPTLQDPSLQDPSLQDQG